MKYDPEIHRRCSSRLRGYDYSKAGAYFITICSKGRECLFGDIVHGEMRVNDAGNMIHAAWNDLPARFNKMERDEFIVMPNHVHGIVVLICRGESCIRPSFSSSTKQGYHKDRPYGTLSDSIGRIAQALKSMTTHQYINGVRRSAWKPFSGKLWQRNYWDHVIRNESELDRIRAYIMNNPAQWASDQLNPGRM